MEEQNSIIYTPSKGKISKVESVIMLGPIEIQRRYSDFDSIRNLLIKRWPGCYIPSLPSKVKLAHSDEEFL